MLLRQDPFDISPIEGVAQYDGGKETASLYFDTTVVAVAVGDWVAVYPGNTGNPGAIDGETYQAGDADVAGGDCDTVGIALEALAITSTGFLQVQIAGRYIGANVEGNSSPPANGDPLCIGSTHGRAIEQVVDASTTSNRRQIGTCRSTPDAATNTATVDVIRHPKFSGP